MKLKTRLLKSTAIFLAVTIISEIFFPSVAYALTDGPTSPEFSTFEPVASTDMVNTFTGDFSYNLPVLQIPGPDGGGYAMSLSYHSGVSSEEEASWVGYGWTLNPGSIVRSVKGVPDDYSGETITKYNKSRVNWTATAQEKYNLEIKSEDQGSGALSVNFGKTYNNFSGLSKLWGLNLSGSNGDVSGSIGVQFSGRDPIFSINVQPADKLEFGSKAFHEAAEKVKNKLKMNKVFNSKSKLLTKLLKHENDNGSNLKLKADKPRSILLATAYGLVTNSQSNKTLSVTPNHGFEFNYINTNAVWAYIPAGFEFGYNGTVSANANVPSLETPSYGYYFNQSPTGDFMSDYYVEKSSFYNRRMKYLGIPFSSPDNFMVSGEGLNGGFRLYAPKVGHYYPNETESVTRVFNGGPAKGIGLPVQVSIGTQLLGGNRKLQSRRTWHENTDAFDGYTFNGDTTNYFFRFQNDMGGTVEYSSAVDVVTATLDGAQDINFVPGTRKMEPDFSGMGLYSSVNNSATKVGRSSYIRKIKNGNEKFDGFVIVNDQGMKYNYRNPLFVRNEASIQVNVDQNTNSGDGYIIFKAVSTSNDGINKPIVPGANEQLMGEFKSSQYASTYLVSSITSPDYIDNAPLGVFGEEDFGGWTSFKYKKKYGEGTSQWYRWRAPYNGLHYERNSISDKKDDMGRVSYGEKEVSYLTSAETKTHIAFFITNKRVLADFPDYNNGNYTHLTSFLTGSQLDRLDGLGANTVESTASNSPTAKDPAQTLEYLERIVLFSKNDLTNPSAKPLQVTYFKYNYSLCRKLPNSNAPSTTAGYKDSGKLTLERVWTESEDVVNTKISPYIFKYEYKAQYAPEIVSQYPSVTSYTVPFAGTAKENPDYAPQLLDRWGNNQYDGKKRFEEGKEWLYQGQYESSLMFDPAAWQLKQIILPSGGEIHIQYEQKDYHYVQDKKAMAMVSLEGNGTIDDYDFEDNKFYLNLKDIGINIQNYDEVLAQKELIRTELNKKYVYFKFLYALQGNNPSLNNCRSEYIDGYVTVDDVKMEPETNTGINDYRIYLKLGENQSTFAFDENEKAVPKQVCYAFLNTQRGGLVNNDNCEPELNKLKTFNDDMENYYNSVIGSVSDDFPDYGTRTGGHRDNMRDLIKDLKKHDYEAPSFSDIKNNQGNYCMSINHALSYIRVPMLKPKRGDGVRVKRLLLYDKGLEVGDAALYGSEYIYENEDGTSSGVATNEPAAGREENALVTLLERYKQSFISRIISGRNKIEFEGPVGESLLPNPSVGHSRVVVRNIHTGKTGGGFVEYKFHTVKEYPLSQDFTFNAPNGELNNIRAINKTTVKDNRKRDYLPLPLGLINLTINKEWATQGYNFILYNIHGQPESTTTYGGGVYETGVPFVSTKYPLISQMKYEFYEPGEKITMLRPDGNHYLDLPGKEMDVTMEMRSIKEKSFSPSLDFDISVAIYAPQVNINFGFGLSYSDALMNTHVTSKVTTYPIIQKRIISMQDGITSITENVGFSPETGKPLLTKTYDSYNQLTLAKANGASSAATHNGHYYTMNIPASWIYGDPNTYANPIGPITTYSGANGTNELSLTAGTITTYGNSLAEFIGNEITPKPDPGVIVGSGYNAKSYTNVVSADVKTYGTYNITSDALLNAEYGTLAGITALDSRLRPKANYIYKTDKTVTDNIAGGDQNRTYNSGFYTNFSFPNMINPCTNCQWLKTSEITRYSPNGIPIEEMDIMNLFSAVKMGYRKTLPVMTAQNATNGSIAFRSFEDETSGVSSTTAHSGAKSLLINASATTTVLGGSTPHTLQKLASNSSVPYTNYPFANYPFANNGAVLKFWAKESAATSYTVTLNTTSIATPVTLIAQTGEWRLYQQEISSTDMNNLANGLVEVKITPNATVYLDDIRFEPYDCASSCYVFDQMSRLIASFDDQHFGIYYQYDQEGKLVRKKIETEKGIMTVQENHQNVPTVLKP